MANTVDPDQTAPIGAVCSGSRLFVSMLNSSVMLGNYLQQTTSADDIFMFFLGALRVKVKVYSNLSLSLCLLYCSICISYEFSGTKPTSDCLHPTYWKMTLNLSSQ